MVYARTPTAVLGHTDGRVCTVKDVAGNDIIAVGIPDMHVHRVANDDVVNHSPMVSLAKFQSAVE